MPSHRAMIRLEVALHLLGMIPSAATSKHSLGPLVRRSSSPLFGRCQVEPPRGRFSGPSRDRSRKVIASVHLCEIALPASLEGGRRTVRDPPNRIGRSPKTSGVHPLVQKNPTGLAMYRSNRTVVPAWQRCVTVRRTEPQTNRMVEWNDSHRWQWHDQNYRWIAHWDVLTGKDQVPGGWVDLEDRHVVGSLVAAVEPSARRI